MTLATTALGPRSAGPRRMLVLCPYPEGTGAGQRLKFEQYYDDWRAAEFEVLVSPFMDMAMWRVLYEPGHFLTKAVGMVKGYFRRLRDLRHLRSFDLVYVHMWVTPIGGTFFERLTRRFAKRLVFDLEDNVLIDNRSGRRTARERLLRLIRGAGKYHYLVKTADAVVTSSPFLNATCLALNRRKACTYISSSVDTDRFTPRTRYSNDNVVTIGWTGTFSTRPMLDLLRGVFQELAKRVPFRLKVIGNFDYELAGVDLEVVRWSAETEVIDLQDFDIGVYPLPANEWVMGKSGLKAIQYMAFALPIVASDAGVNPMILKNGENALLVRSDEEWLEALERLVRDPALRRRLGEAARAACIRNHSTGVVATHYRGVLDDVMRIAP